MRLKSWFCLFCDNIKITFFFFIRIEKKARDEFEHLCGAFAAGAASTSEPPGSPPHRASEPHCAGARNATNVFPCF